MQNSIWSFFFPVFPSLQLTEFLDFLFSSGIFISSPLVVNLFLKEARMGLVKFLFVFHPFFPQGMFLSVFSWFFSSRESFPPWRKILSPRDRATSFFPPWFPCFWGLSALFFLLLELALFYFESSSFSELSVLFQILSLIVCL